MIFNEKTSRNHGALMHYSVVGKLAQPDPVQGELKDPDDDRDACRQDHDDYRNTIHENPQREDHAERKRYRNDRSPKHEHDEALHDPVPPGMTDIIKICLSSEVEPEYYVQEDESELRYRPLREEPRDPTKVPSDDRLNGGENPVV